MSSTRPRSTASTRSSTSPAPAWATTAGPRRTSSRSSPRASTAPTRSRPPWPSWPAAGSGPCWSAGRRSASTGRPGRRGPHRGQPRRARVPLRRRARLGGRQQAGRGRRPARRARAHRPRAVPRAAGRWPGCCRWPGSGLAGPLGSGRQYWSWITLQDEVRALAWAIDQPSLSGTVNLTGPQPLPQIEVIKAVASALGPAGPAARAVPGAEGLPR